MSWRASVLTLFPEMFPGPLGHSLAGEALEKGLWTLETANFREHRHRQASARGRYAGGRRTRDGDPLRCRGRRDRPCLAASRRAAAPRDEPTRRAGDTGIRARARRRPRRRDSVRAFRGNRRARDRGAWPHRGLARRHRARGRGNRRHGADRGLRAALARRDGQGTLGRRGELRGRAPRISAFYPPARVGRTRYSRGAALGRSRRIAAWRRAEAERLTRERRPDLWGARRRRE